MLCQMHIAGAMGQEQVCIVDLIWTVQSRVLLSVRPTPRGGGGLAEFQGGWVPPPPPRGGVGLCGGPWVYRASASKEERGKKRKHSDVIHIDVSDSDASASSSSCDLVSSFESSSDDDN